MVVMDTYKMAPREKLRFESTRALCLHTTLDCCMLPSWALPVATSHKSHYHESSPCAVHTLLHTILPFTHCRANILWGGWAGNSGCICILVNGHLIAVPTYGYLRVQYIFVPYLWNPHKIREIKFHNWKSEYRTTTQTFMNAVLKHIQWKPY